MGGETQLLNNFPRVTSNAGMCKALVLIHKTCGFDRMFLRSQPRQCIGVTVSRVLAVWNIHKKDLKVFESATKFQHKQLSSSFFVFWLGCFYRFTNYRNRCSSFWWNMTSMHAGEAQSFHAHEGSQTAFLWQLNMRAIFLVSGLSFFFLSGIFKNVVFILQISDNVIYGKILSFESLASPSLRAYMLLLLPSRTVK